MFINHSCFLLEGTDSILLADPWMEGTAFNDGWALLDQSTSNNLLIDYLESSEKKFFIWYSHEHSDHFSTSFVHALQNRNLEPVFLFHETGDKRVVSYLRKLNFEVIEVLDGEEIVIEPEFSIRTWNFYSGDSYSLIRHNNIKILNLNDCDVRSQDLMKELKQKLQGAADEIDILFTQFGYANWIGNEDDFERRREAATARLKKLMFQVESLQPKAVVPFASFIYFCHSENSYMNREQNTPQMVSEFAESHNFSAQTIFLKPWQEIDLSSENYLEEMQLGSEGSLQHWENCLKSASEIKIEKKAISEEEVTQSIAEYRLVTNRKFYYIPFFLSIFKIISPIYVKTWKDNKIYKCSYASKPRIQKRTEYWDIGMSRSSAQFLFSREYGADTLSVCARFRCSSEISYSTWQEFFEIQIFMREDLGTDSLISSLRTLASFPIRKLTKTFRNIG